MSKSYPKPTDKDWIDFFQGKSSEKDYAILKALLDKGEADEVLERLFSAEMNNGNETHIEIDAATAYSKFEQHLKPQKNYKSFPKAWMAVAASLVLLVTFSLFYQYWGDSSAMEFSSGGMEIKNVQLPDGSTTILNANSSISYHEEDGQRIVRLLGEAFFDVTRNVDRPFVISVNDAEIRVLGTSFNVKATGQQQTVISVSSGKVQVTDSDQKVVLVKNEEAIIEASDLQKREANEYSTSWIEKRLVYEHIPLKRIFSDIEAWYGVNIVSNEVIDSIPYTATIHLDKGLDTFLKNLGISENINFTIFEKNVRLSKE